MNGLLVNMSKSSCFNLKGEFNDSIFTNKFDDLLFYDFVTTSNRADDFLMSRFPNVPSGNLNEWLKKKGSNKRTKTLKIMNLNPKDDYLGKNVYTMDMYGHKPVYTAPFTPIHVVPKESYNTAKIAIHDYATDQVYTLSSYLTPLESAIMLKYYAISNFMMRKRKNTFSDDIKITDELFNVVRKYFKDNRSWFVYGMKTEDEIRERLLPFLFFYDLPIKSHGLI